MNVTRSRLRAGDALALGFHGLRTRPLRVVLSALGIAIGIAAMVAVIGISTSSEALVKQRLAQLGTNLLTASAGIDFTGSPAPLPADAAQKIRRMDDVTHASSIAVLKSVNVYRSQFIDPGKTGGLTVAAADLDLLDATGSTLASGDWLNEATERYPATVLGATAARRLGIHTPGHQIWIGDEYYTVAGILDPSPLAPELDATALVGIPHATESLGFTGSPTTIYERSADDAVDEVRALLPRTISPEQPTEVQISRPSDALAAKNTIDQAFTALLVGVGSIALLVGGIGVANTMVIAVLERRREIGLRRALGATRHHITAQFLVEAILLSLYGGIAGVTLGVLVTAAIAHANHWILTIPPVLPLAGITATLLVGTLAGALPALRAAQTPPTTALNS